MGKYKILVITCLFFQTLFSQKAIVSNVETIAFLKKEILTDEKQYKESVEKFKPRFLNALKQQIKLENDLKGLKTSEKELNEILSSIEPLFEMEMLKNNNEEVEFYQEVSDSVCNFVISNKVSGAKKETVILLKTLMYVNSDGQPKDYFYNNEEEIVDIKEFRNETQIINGYTCFRVNYVYKEIPEKGTDFFFGELFLHERELWVTEKIKQNIHPVIHNLSILEKYYPLKIIENTQGLYGKYYSYDLVKLVLK